jgi:hypothetical protein
VEVDIKLLDIEIKGSKDDEQIDLLSMFRACVVPPNITG